MATLVEEFTKGRRVVHKESGEEGVIVEGPIDSEVNVLWKKDGKDKLVGISALLLNIKLASGDRVVYSEDGKGERLGTIFEDVLKICEPAEVLVMFDGCKRVARKKTKELALMPVAVV